MINAVKNFLEKNNVLNDKNTFIVGFSGGIDSLCLLDIMFELSKLYNFKLIAAHLNHNWRGEESKSEQQRCENFAKDYGIEFITQTLEYSDKKSENEARCARYTFFEKCKKKYKNAYILTAHNAQDNAETVLYRISKGTGLSGLIGIPEKIEKNGIVYLRPFLNIYRKQIEEYCNSRQLVANEDSSNNDVKYKRNLIRHKVLPVLKEINPKAEKAINSLSELARENEIIMNLLIEDVFDKNGDIFRDKFIKLHEVLKSKVLHKFFINLKLDYDKKKILEVLDFLLEEENINKRYSLTKNLWITFNKEFIKTVFFSEKIKEEISINGTGVYKLSNGKSFEVLDCTELPETFPVESENYVYADISKIKGSLVLRTRRDGDIIQPFGMKGKMKLKKYLISKKTDRESRDNLMLLACGNEVLWVIGVGLSEKLKVANLPCNVFKYI